MPAARPPAPPALPEPTVVRGQELRAVPRQAPAQQLIWLYAWMAGAVVLAGMAFQLWRQRRAEVAST
jgi:hypothetical protein